MDEVLLPFKIARHRKRGAPFFFSLSFPRAEVGANPKRASWRNVLSVALGGIADWRPVVGARYFYHVI